MKFNLQLHMGKLLAWLVVIIFLTSCASYKQNIMFTVEDTDAIDKAAEKVEKNYVVQKNDYLHITVYANNGERIIDPDFQLTQGMNTQGLNARPDPLYLVNMEGTIKAPMIEPLHVEGLTIREVEAILQKEYTQYYTNPFVIVTFSNKRVIVLGNNGGSVVPLLNENVTLAEILAESHAITNTAKAHNIRVLRGKEIFVVDFSTVKGYLEGNMIMLPGDIVYVEPVRKPVPEAVRDYASILSIITSLAALIIVITN